MSIQLHQVRTENPKRSTRVSPPILGKALIKDRRFKDKHKAKAFADIHLLLSSGLDVHSSMDILIAQCSQDWERKKYGEIQERIVAGESLANAMRAVKLAGSYEFYSLKIGEESGKIIEVLSEIKRYYERRIKQRRQVSGALTYPVMVLLTALLAVGFMLNVIVPMFEEVFKRFQGELPGLTQKIIHMSEWTKQHFLLLLLFSSAMVILIHYLWKNDSFRGLCQRSLLRVPIFGPLVRHLQSARFCHVMSLLSSARAPLVQSLNMVADMISFLPLKSRVSQIADQITAGKSFHEAVAKAGFFDRKFSSLIKAGEEVNQLEYAFSRLNDQYNQEIDHKMAILSSLLEPMLIVLVGGMVAIILIAMYLPLFQIGSSIY